MGENNQGSEPDQTQNSSSGRVTEPENCANCGQPINMKTWHPVVTRTDEKGNFHVYAFCDEDCKDEWHSATP